MKVLTALVAAASSAALLASAMATSESVGSDNAAAAAPTNNNLPNAIPGEQDDNPYASNPNGKPSASQICALKSHRIAERRRRVQEKLANGGNVGGSENSSSLPRNLQRMSEEELEAAYLASIDNSDGSGKPNGKLVKEPATNEGFLRKAHEDLKEGKEWMENDGHRKLWGNSGGGGDPYAPMGGMAAETEYYGEFLLLFLGLYFLAGERESGGQGG